MFFKYKNKILITSVLTILPLFIGLILWNILPAKLPMRFTFDGTVDEYAPKIYLILGLPLFLLVIHLICVFASIYDEKSDKENSIILNIVFFSIPVLSICICSFLYAYSLDLLHSLNISSLCYGLAGIMYIILGAAIFKVKQNSTFGFRLPWTMNNEIIWNKTNKLGCYLMLITGIITLISTLFINPKSQFILFMILNLFVFLIPCIYSFVLYKLLQN